MRELMRARPFTYIKEIHDEHKIPLKVFTVENNTPSFTFCEEKEMDALSVFTSPMPDCINSQSTTIKMKVLSLIVRDEEYHWMGHSKRESITDIRYLFLRGLTLSCIPIDLVNNKSSVIVFGSCIRECKSTTLNTTLLNLPIGVGISKQLKTKVDQNCQQKCPKYLKCILNPEAQECNLKYFRGEE